MNHEPRAMSHEPVTISTRSIHDLFNYVSWVSSNTRKLFHAFRKTLVPYSRLPQKGRCIFIFCRALPLHFSFDSQRFNISKFKNSRCGLLQRLKHSKFRNFKTPKLHNSKLQNLKFQVFKDVGTHKFKQINLLDPQTCEHIFQNEVGSFLACLKYFCNK